jgi:hypothetical protein
LAIWAIWLGVRGSIGMVDFFTVPPVPGSESEVLKAQQNRGIIFLDDNRFI